MKIIIALILLPLSSQAWNQCGPKPWQKSGCSYKCVDTQWVEICDKEGFSQSMSCGMKPFVSWGCKAVCTNGKWVEVCD